MVLVDIIRVLFMLLHSTFLAHSYMPIFTKIMQQQQLYSSGKKSQHFFYFYRNIPKNNSFIIVLSNSIHLKTLYLCYINLPLFLVYKNIISSFSYLLKKFHIIYNFFRILLSLLQNLKKYCTNAFFMVILRHKER